MNKHETNLFQCVYQNYKLSLVFFIHAIEAHGVQTQTSIPMNPSLQRVVWAVLSTGYMARYCPQLSSIKTSSLLFKVKKLMAVGNPNLLRSIPREVIEVVLAQHQAACTEGTPVEGNRIEEPTANNSFKTCQMYCL